MTTSVTIAIVGQANIGVACESAIMALSAANTDMAAERNATSIEITQSLIVSAEVIFNGANVTFGGDDVIW